ncbi:MAG: class I SAM-dependent methyltransferase [Phycisphaerae bacterium]|nr:class I SAM-dependent methyltransferase [Phycisphaerae bacterium]
MSNEYFDKQAAEWDDNPLRIKRAQTIADFICEKIPLNKQFDVLDYGCGTGLLGFLLADKVAWAYCADNSDGMLAEVQKKIAAQNVKNVRTVKFDIMKDKPLNRSFDLIASVMTIHHIPDVSAAIKKFASLLKSGGRLVIADLCAEDGSFHTGGETVHNGLEPQEIKKYFEAVGISSPVSQNIFEIEKNNRTYPVFCVYGRKI